jgi:1-deoxy-D-xylulose-5-phosphate synthase
MALAAKHNGSGRKVAAVIGDGAMTAGMAFEALNHAAHTDADMLVVLNDNQMSIGHNKGGLNTYFSRIWASKPYTQFREGSKKVLAKIPSALDLAQKAEEHVKGLVAPGMMFEELGFNYIGPIDGHDIDTLVYTLKNMRELKGPQLLHIMTTKGKGFAPAEIDPVGYHAINKIEVNPNSSPVSSKKYQDVFGQWLCDMAEQDKALVGITPAMCEGSGMVEFSQRFPERYFDVAIAEQHAITLAAGMACDGLKPVVAIYSTFLQRGYDQLVHDVALQNLDVLFAIDRAGLVGEDGATHAGAFDLAFLRCIPNMMVIAPSDEDECRQLLYTGYLHQGPTAVRYPRGSGPGIKTTQEMVALPIGKGVVRRHGTSIAIMNFGSLLESSLAAGDKLNATVVDMRFVKPIDELLIDQLAQSHELIVTVEENTIAGGAGSAVNEYLANNQIILPTLNLGLSDEFLNHGTHQELLNQSGLDSSGIYKAAAKRMDSLKKNDTQIPNR